MLKTKVEAYANYEVYVHDGEKAETLCLCNSLEVAATIAKRLVMGAEMPNIKVYVTNVEDESGLCFVPGGGWYDVYWRGDDGKLHQGTLG